MEKHRCKLCLKSFANGRALGGHMRSHMLNLYVPPKTDQLTQHTESAHSFSEEEEQETEDKELLSYELRENPKRSIRLVDPEFAFAVDAGSVVLQDGESDTESSKNLEPSQLGKTESTRRRSKRIRQSGTVERQHQCQTKKMKLSQIGRTKSWAEPEPVSSISDTIPEEDVAYCLMMLSRDKWRREKDEFDEEQDDQSYDSDFDSDSDREIKLKSTRVRAKYRCETCDKVFKSYQALGGHRASHKKIRLSQTESTQPSMAETENGGGASTLAAAAEEKIHECPVCFRVFSSGQALGGHKRSHVIGSSTTAINMNTPAKPVAKHSQTLIDLNLPAPIEDDDFSQIELSAVSDAEFVKPMKR